MATKEIKGIIQLQRNTQDHYEAIKTTFVPRKGEVVFVDTTYDGLRAKIGDGVTTYEMLQFADEKLRELISNVVVRGYYDANEFYMDSAKTIKYVKYANRLYIDNPTEHIYTCDGTDYATASASVNPASETTAGIAKLYGSNGASTDGAMTQKSITDGVKAIKFALDDVETECLKLELPW